MHSGTVPEPAEPAGSLVEIVPNVSEGRRGAVVDEITSAFTDAAPGVLLLDRSSDPDHDRTVLTFAGTPTAVLDAAVAGAVACAELLDLTAHDGVHPRLGVLDVLPFVPLGTTTTEVCAALAREAGQRIAALGVPVYLYGAAALHPARQHLPAVRAGGFEALRTLAVRDPDRAPDLGGPQLHPTAGAVAVGVRPFLIAYNVDLASDDLVLARRIATAVRERDGGLPAVRALGLRLERRGCVQVSCNLLDFTITPPVAVYDLVAALAARAGVNIARTEVVGLVPAAALDGLDAQSRYQVETGSQVVEWCLAGTGRPPGTICP